MINKLSLILIIFFSLFSLNYIFCEEPNDTPPTYVGEFFNTPVSKDNHLFVKGVITVFGNKWGPRPTTPEETEKIVWEQLLLSYEAFRRGITVEQEEINQEVDKILEADRVDFDWRVDKEAYEEWVRKKINAASQLFENQLKHLLQIQKLRQQVMDSFDPPVNEKEAYQEFFNENNNLGVELVQFDELKDAKKFYKEIKGNPGLWEKEKEEGEYKFGETGSISLEALIDLWKIDKGAVYRMHKLKIGSLYPPATVWKGYAVFKVLHKQYADKSRWKKFKDSYYNQIRTRKKYQGLWKWIEDLKKQAKIKVYDKIAP